MTSFWCRCCLQWTDFKFQLSGVTIFNFKQVNGTWVVTNLLNRSAGRSNQPELLFKIGPFTGFAKFHRKIPAPDSLFNQVLGWMPGDLLKWKLRYRCFPVNFAKILTASSLLIPLVAAASVKGKLWKPCKLFSPYILSVEGNAAHDKPNFNFKLIHIKLFACYLQISVSTTFEIMGGMKIKPMFTNFKDAVNFHELAR